MFQCRRTLFPKSMRNDERFETQRTGPRGAAAPLCDVDQFNLVSYPRTTPKKKSMNAPIDMHGLMSISTDYTTYLPICKPLMLRIPFWEPRRMVASYCGTPRRLLTKPADINRSIQTGHVSAVLTPFTLPCNFAQYLYLQYLSLPGKPCHRRCVQTGGFSLSKHAVVGMHTPLLEPEGSTWMRSGDVRRNRECPQWEAGKGVEELDIGLQSRSIS